MMFILWFWQSSYEVINAATATKDWMFCECSACIGDQTWEAAHCADGLGLFLLNHTDGDDFWGYTGEHKILKEWRKLERFFRVVLLLTNHWKWQKQNIHLAGVLYTLLMSPVVGKAVFSFHPSTESGDKMLMNLYITFSLRLLSVPQY